MRFENNKDIIEYFNFSKKQVEQFLSGSGELLALAKETDSFVRKVIEDGHELNPMASFLFINSYFLLLASFKTAASGHVAAVYPQIRAALESCCYGYLMSRDAELIDVWSYRDRSEDDRKKAKRKLGAAVSDVKRMLKIEGHESLSEMVETGYESSITFGAHPNSRSVIGHLESQPDDGSEYWRFNLNCIYDTESSEAQRAVFSCIEYGLMIAGITVISHQPHPEHNELMLEFMKIHDSKEALIATLGWNIHSPNSDASQVIGESNQSD